MIHRILSKVVEIDHFKARHSSALGLTVWGAFYAKKRATEVTRRNSPSVYFFFRNVTLLSNILEAHSAT